MSVNLHLNPGDRLTADQTCVGLRDVTAEDAHAQWLQTALEAVPGPGGGAVEVPLQGRLGRGRGRVREA